MSRTNLGTLAPTATPSSAASTVGLSIGDYLIRRLQDYGIRDVFGIPGDYVLGFYTMLDSSPINVVGCTREDCAGFAADAYARVDGMGAVCVTYCVGGLSLCNSIAGAYAEKSPVVVITGSPGMNERINNPLLHHKVRDFRTQAEVFEKICVAGTELTDPHDRLSRNRSRAGCRGAHQAARLHRIAARHGPRRARRAAFVSLDGNGERSGGAGRSGRRSRGLDQRQPQGGDHRRRGDPPLRPARRGGGVGRELANPDRRHDPGQERRQRDRIRCTSACTKARWAARR